MAPVLTVDSVQTPSNTSAESIKNINFPRLFYWNEAFLSKRESNNSHEMILEELLETVQDPYYRDFEKEWFTDCQPIETIPFYPTCNSLHELDVFLDGSSAHPVTLLSMAGSWRSVWRTTDPVNEEQIILKLLHLHGNFDVESARAHETDIRVMDRLTASPRVISAYGFCGQSVLTQFAPAPTSQAVKDQELSWRDRFVMALQLTRGLAELHALRPIAYDRIKTNGMNLSDPINLLHSLPLDQPLLFSHHDINLANTVSVRAKQLQWNDFNLGIIMQNRTYGSGECQVPIRYEGTLWRSPEEIQNATGYLQTPFPSDVYAFGSLLFTILTRHQPWTHLEEPKGNSTEDDLATKKLRGDLPNLPLKYKPKRKEAKVLWAAVRACFRRDPQERPTAYRLAMSMEVALIWIQTKRELSSRTIEQLFSV